MRALTLKEIADAIGGRLIGGCGDTEITGVSTDSRSINAGEIFFPIVGDKYDGHDYINSVINRGIVSFVSHRDIECSDMAYILVADTRRALMDLAEYYRSLFKIPAVAVTGSVGKTSVKNRVAAVVSQKYKTLKTEGNYNNEIGLPLTVFNLSEETEAAIFEMGMNSFGEISNLSKIVKPDIALITNVGTAHIERLGNREGILKAKLEIIDGMSADGCVVLNYDNDILKTVKLPQKTVWVSAIEKADVYAKDITYSKEKGCTFKICYTDREIEVCMPIGAAPLILNALMSAAVGFLLGLSDNEIKNGIGTETKEKGRLQTHKKQNGSIIIDDTYNANPDSMKLGLDILCNNNMERAAILGDMFEQGECAEAFHREVGEYAAKAGVSILAAVGADAKYYKDAFDQNKNDTQKSFYFESKESFFSSENIIGENQAVLVKASRGMKFEEVLDYIMNK